MVSEVSVMLEGGALKEKAGAGVRRLVQVLKTCSTLNALGKVS